MRGLDLRIQARMRALRLTFEKVAERMEHHYGHPVSYQAVQSWGGKGRMERRIPRPDKWEALALALETTVEELFYGQPAPPTKVARKDVAGLSLSSVKPSHPLPIIELQGRVPLISWQQAGQWKEAPFHPADAEGWLQVTARVGAHAFALRAIGDSMEPKIPEGAHVVIDPEAAPAHKSIVLAGRPGEAATLRMLWLDGDTPYLKPLNPSYPLLAYPAGTHIIGVAVQVVLDL